MRSTTRIPYLLGGRHVLVVTRMRSLPGLSLASREVKATFNASLQFSSIFTLPATFVLTMSTTVEDKASAPGPLSVGLSAAPSAISKDFLKEALKEVLTENPNPSLLVTARILPDEDAGKGNENSFYISLPTSVSCRPFRALLEAWLALSNLV